MEKYTMGDRRRRTPRFIGRLRCSRDFATARRRLPRMEKYTMGRYVGHRLFLIRGGFVVRESDE